jgi:SAM-dependent methyltransferase
MGFLVSPAELEARRGRCRSVVEPLAKAARQFVAQCNVCGSENNCVIAYSDRYGMPIRTAMCTGCGLVYLVDRLTQDGYADFYRGGAYRKLTSSFAGSVATLEDLQADQGAYARNLMCFLEGRVSRSRKVRVLDVGGSSGQVVQELAKRFGVRGTVIDPSEDEIAAARRLGLEGIVGTVETWDTPERFDMILMCRTIEHLWDLRGSMQKIRRLLKPDGLFYCDFLDYMELCRMTGHPQTVSKVDHCYWLTLDNAPALFRAMGFEVLSLHMVPNPQFIGLLLRQCAPAAIAAMEWADVQPVIRALQQIIAEWKREPAAPRGLPSRVSRKVTRMARSAVGR